MLANWFLKRIEHPPDVALTVKSQVPVPDDGESTLTEVFVTAPPVIEIPKRLVPLGEFTTVARL